MESQRREGLRSEPGDGRSEGRRQTLADRVQAKGEPVERIVADFVEMLEQRGLHASLGFLNGRVRYRYTGVYRFDATVLRNVALFDRENPSVLFAPNVLVLPDGYGGIVRHTKRPSGTEEATQGDRRSGAAARVSIGSYLGIPLRLDGCDGHGTLCHWDGRPRLAPDGEAELLQRLASHLTAWLAPARAD